MAQLTEEQIAAGLENIGAPATAEPEAAAPALTSAEQDAAITEQGAGAKPFPEQGLSDPTSTVDAAMGGGMKSVFETKDFVFGQTEDADKSTFRKNVEGKVDALKENSALDGFAAGIGQFTVGMIGAGKLTAPLKLAGTAYEVVKAAAVGAVAFDPHEERLSNLVQDTFLANPVTGYLAADPTDSAAEGRLKSAMESIGLDLVVMGGVTAGLKLYKAVKGGDAKAIQAATQEAEELPVTKGVSDLENGKLEAPVEVAEDVPPQLDAEGKPLVAANEGVKTIENKHGVFLDTRGQGKQFHGTSQEITGFDEGHYNDANYYGNGFYTTDAADAGMGYMNKGRGGSKNMYEVTENGPLNLFDMESPEGFEAVKADLESRSSLVADAIEEESPKNLRELYDAMREVGTANGMSRIEIHEDFDIIQTALDEAGYHGMGQNGGLRTGTQNHTVKIYFNPGRDVTVSKVDHEGFKYKAAEATEPGALDPNAGADGLPAAANDVDVQAVGGITDAKAGDGVSTGFRQPPDVDLDAVLNGMEADAKAMTDHGSWYGAIEAGHTFGRGEGVPWIKMNGPADVENFVAQVADASETRLATLKGGDVMADSRVQRMVAQRAALFGEDPALLMGQLQAAGKASRSAVADMEAGYLVSQRMFQDTFALASRIKLGDYTQYGSKEAALADLKKRVSIAADVYGNARAITANAGRAVRRMRGEFKLDPKDIAALNELDGDQLATLISNSGGNPRSLAKVVNPSLWSKIIDHGQYLLINNLVSGWKTQLINITSNVGMMATRPMEKLLGSSVQAAAAYVRGDVQGAALAGRTFKQAIQQYAYTGNAFRQGFGDAIRAFKINDSVLSPHSVEYYKGNQGAESTLGPLPWRPMVKDGEADLGGILYNAYLALTPKSLYKAAGLPTRALGMVDEAVKQTVYRSKVMANAHVEAVETGMAQGLTGDQLNAFTRSYVSDKLDNAFDDMGVGTDPVALREAKIATFQQDLKSNVTLPGMNFGQGVQNLTHAVPALKFVLPFVKTPTNVIRYGWKLTPGLNLAQTEFRRQLLGEFGAEMQAEATGQMAIGLLFMGTAATLVAEGQFTGGGPTDYKLRQELLATGWKPYSFVRTDKASGARTYLEAGRLDPFVVPFGIIADVQDAMNAAEKDEEDPGIGAAIGGLFIGLTKQFRSKTYLQNLNQLIEAIEDPDDKLEAYAGQQAANLIPLSAAQRQLNSDPYLREARSVTDRMLATVPGLSDTLPAKYDAFGEPIISRKGLWTSDSGEDVDLEMQRLIIENGASITRVQPKPEAGVDLREITMASGKNAYEEYQKLSGRPTPRTKPLKAVVAEVIASEAYKKAPDGAIGTKGTKLWILHAPVQKYRSAAMKIMRADPIVRGALLKNQLKVQAAYAAQRNPQAAAGGLDDVGTAFGMDLGNGN